MTNDVYKKLPSFDETPFGTAYSRFSILKDTYEKVRVRRNKTMEVLEKIESFNQGDRQIIDFQTSVGAWGIDSEEWKFIIIKGIKSLIESYDKKISHLTTDINNIIK